MANFRNNKQFMTANTDICDSEERLGQIRPEAIANALLREAITNARAQGNDIRMALIHKVGLPLELVDLAREVDYSNLEVWARYLKRGFLKKGINLQSVELMLKIKQAISDELMTPPTEEETRDLQFQSTIETAVVRRAERPQKTNNPNFTPEKGSATAPEYDGKDDQYDKQANLWVFPTEIIQWTVDGPGKTIVKIEDLRKLYLNKMRSGDASGIPIHHLKYEVKDYIREWKPALHETIERPDKDRRNEIEFWKRNEIRNLRNAVAEAENGRPGVLWQLAFKYLGRSARVSIKDISFEKRIENSIRRKFNNKKARPEGKAYLPPIAAGDMLRPMIDEKVKSLVAANPTLDSRLPWVIKCFFDSELREDRDGSNYVTPGVGILLNRHRDSESGD